MHKTTFMCKPKLLLPIIWGRQTVPWPSVAPVNLEDCRQLGLLACNALTISPSSARQLCWPFEKSHQGSHMTSLYDWLCFCSNEILRNLLVVWFVVVQQELEKWEFIFFNPSAPFYNRTPDIKRDFSWLCFGCHYEMRLQRDSIYQSAHPLPLWLWSPSQEKQKKARA